MEARLERLQAQRKEKAKANLENDSHAETAQVTEFYETKPTSSQDHRLRECRDRENVDRQPFYETNPSNSEDDACGKAKGIDVGTQSDAELSKGEPNGSAQDACSKGTDIDVDTQPNTQLSKGEPNVSAQDACSKGTDIVIESQPGTQNCETNPTVDDGLDNSQGDRFPLRTALARRGITIDDPDLTEKQFIMLLEEKLRNQERWRNLE